jgi:hypothetical protein
MATCNTLRTETRNFFREGDPEISDDTKALFTQYSGIPEDQIIPHVRKIVSMPIASTQYCTTDLIFSATKPGASSSTPA